MFEDAKRPVTVELLQRLNLSAIAGEAGMSARWRAIQRTEYSRQVEAPQMEFVMERAECVSPRGSTDWCQAGGVLGHEKTAGSVLISLLIEFGLPDVICERVP